MRVVAETGASLALTKYWGKSPGNTNIPATSSLAVTLESLRTRSVLSEASAAGAGGVPSDRVIIDGEEQAVDKFLPVIDAVRTRAASPRAVVVESRNSFPTAAGLASSSSGFAALALGLNAFFDTGLAEAELSAIARLGSGSAARAVFGGFTVWPAGAEQARPFADAGHWPDLRVIAVVVQSGPKDVSSRAGMESARTTSPYYLAWKSSSEALYQTACEAVQDRDLEKLGSAMRQSYLRMFSTMFTSDPPLIYWQPESLALIRHCEELRRRAIPVWETMDAGPQVKLVTLATELARVEAGVREILPDATFITSAVGGAPSVTISGDR